MSTPESLPAARTPIPWKASALIFLTLAALYYFIFAPVTNLSDGAFFGWDTWEYQSMGVNFSKGRGIQRFGGMEPFEAYQFEKFSQPPGYYQDFFARAGSVNLKRPPAYPLFLGLTYKVFGVHPHAAKVLQLLMLVVIAAALPFFGYRLWGGGGFLGGLLAGYFFVDANRPIAEVILTECLVCFAVFLVFAALLAYEHRRRAITAALLGASLGAAVLTKGSLVFLPALVGAACLLRAARHRDLAELRRLGIVVATAILVVLPWSLFASANAGRFFILSDGQGADQLLADNNEFCEDGNWHPEWDSIKDSFYNTDGIPRDHAARKVVNFYWHRPATLRHLMCRKLLAGFGPLALVWAFMAFITLDAMRRAADRWLKWNSVRITCLALLAPLALLACVGAWWAGEHAKNVLMTWPPLGHAPLEWALLILIATLAALVLTGRAGIRMPAPVWIVSLNFLFVTLIFHGETLLVKSRMVAPMDFLIALACCVGALSLLSALYSSLQRALRWTEPVLIEDRDSLSTRTWPESLSPRARRRLAWAAGVLVLLIAGVWAWHAVAAHRNRAAAPAAQKDIDVLVYVSPTEIQGLTMIPPDRTDSCRHLKTQTLYLPTTRANLKTAEGADLGAAANVRVDFTGEWVAEGKDLTVFRVRVDDGCRLYVDGEVLVDCNGVHSMKNVSSSPPRKLAPGPHHVLAQYFQWGGEAGLQVEYAAADGDFQTLKAGDRLP